MKFWAIVLAAGASTRFTTKNSGMSPKQFINYKGMPLYWESLNTLSNIPNIQGISLALPEPQYHFESIRISNASFTIPLIPVIGGLSRLESMISALKTIPSTVEYVLIHDAARPFFTPKLVRTLCDTLLNTTIAHGVVPSLSLSDTIKEVVDGSIVHTPKRSLYRTIQTPQLFIKVSLEVSLHVFGESGVPPVEITDDATLLEKAGFTILSCEGEEKNKKITHMEDSSMIEEKQVSFSKTVMGYDVHAYTTEEGGRDFILGGILIDTPYKVKAHSDGDILLHAIIDALLAILGCGDIGQIFPDTENKYDSISSAVLLSEIVRKIEERAITILHVDTTIVAQLPIISPYAKKIKENIAYLLGISTSSVSLKSTTEEHLGFTGEKKGIKAYAIITFCE